MILRRVSHLIVSLGLCLSAAHGVEVGPARVVADQGGYTSCAFVEPGVAGWKGASLICSRVNDAEFAEELWRIPLGEGEPELIGYGRQPRVREGMVVYVGTEPGAEGIWLRDLTGECEQQRLSEDPELQWPTIAPDGEKVACFKPTQRRNGIFLLPIPEAKGEWLINREERQPCYDRDRERMLVTKHGQLWVLAGGAREETQEERITDAGYEHVDASWGPDGDWVAYVGRWTDEAANVGMLHLPSGENTWITEGMSAARSPVISPDGGTLVYIAAAAEGNAIYVREIKRRRPRQDPLQGHEW